MYDIKSCMYSYSIHVYVNVFYAHTVHTLSDQFITVGRPVQYTSLLVQILNENMQMWSRVLAVFQTKCQNGE